jgi:hypothetical protein
MNKSPETKFIKSIGIKIDITLPIRILTPSIKINPKKEPKNTEIDRYFDDRIMVEIWVLSPNSAIATIKNDEIRASELFIPIFTHLHKVFYVFNLLTHL